MQSGPAPVILIIFLVCSLICLGNIFLVSVVATTQNRNVNGTISENTTWTAQTFNFTGNVTVANGVTLTIAPGANVQLNTFYLLVGGTLVAEGTSTNQIIFQVSVPSPNPKLLSPGEIIFMPSSRGWNEQTETGSIIENAHDSGGIDIIDTSPKIDKSSLYIGTYSGIGIEGGAPIISNNYLSGSIYVNGGSPKISNNTITYSGDQIFPQLSGISLKGTNTALIYDNTIIGGFTKEDILITSGSPVIERNIIENSKVGITLYGPASPVLENNTFAQNLIALNIYNTKAGSSSPIIAYNNFESNTQYNIYLGEQEVLGSTADNVYAPYNWWGTIDLFTINQTMYDYKNNYNVGTVTFMPILTSPNTQATPNPNAPISTPNPSPTSSSTMQPQQSATATPQNEGTQTTKVFGVDLLQVATVTLLAVIAILLALVVFYLRKRSINQIEHQTAT